VKRRRNHLVSRGTGNFSSCFSSIGRKLKGMWKNSKSYKPRKKRNSTSTRHPSPPAQKRLASKGKYKTLDSAGGEKGVKVHGMFKCITKKGQQAGTTGIFHTHPKKAKKGGGEKTKRSFNLSPELWEMQQKEEEAGRNCKVI